MSAHISDMICVITQSGSVKRSGLLAPLRVLSVNDVSCSNVTYGRARVTNVNSTYLIAMPLAIRSPLASRAQHRFIAIGYQPIARELFISSIFHHNWPLSRS